ncbi:MAG: hypothetical protein Q4F67_15850, partial [Propionibacteriaceae bacterium]|nr:hypothetical protein [Propionibacteriaceae bacterium]
SIAYDVGRTTQHLMVLLAGPIILGAEKLVRLVTLGRAREARAHTVLACLLLVLFAIVTGTVNRLTGVTAPSPTVRDAGELYEQSHVRAGEVRAAQWLHATRGPNEQIASGYFSGTRLQLAQLNRPVMMRDLFPWSIDREVYVYRGAWELETGEATFYYRGAYLAYPYPEAVIEAHKDTVYANSSTVIYR